MLRQMRGKRARNRMTEEYVAAKQAPFIGIDKEQLLGLIDAKGGDYFRTDLHPRGEEASSAWDHLPYKARYDDLDNELIAQAKAYYGIGSPGAPTAASALGVMKSRMSPEDQKIVEQIVASDTVDAVEAIAPGLMDWTGAGNAARDAHIAANPVTPIAANDMQLNAPASLPKEVKVVGFVGVDETGAPVVTEQRLPVDSPKEVIVDTAIASTSPETKAQVNQAVEEATQKPFYKRKAVQALGALGLIGLLANAARPKPEDDEDEPRVMIRY